MKDIDRDSVVIAGDKVTLRPFVRADATVVTAALHDPDIFRWTATIPNPYLEGHFLSWLEHHVEWWQRGEAAHFAVVDNASASVSGSIAIDGIDWSVGSGRVGYWIASWARRRGLATAALMLLQRWAFEVLELSELDLVTLKGNAASEGVATKSGFSRVDPKPVLNLREVVRYKGALNYWRSQPH